MLSLLGILLGIGLLVAGGTLLVRGASLIASAMGVSPMVVGLTIVGFGTSAPELMINVMGTLRGETGIAFGNVVGSNIANLSLVLGAAAVCRAISIQGQLVLREVPLLLLATTAITVMALDSVLDGSPPVISRSDAIILLLMFGIFLYITVLDYVHSRQQDSLLDDITDSPLLAAGPKSRYAWLQAATGFALLFAGGEVTISNSVAFADRIGIAPTIVGLFVVAVGTSMPELVTSVIAALRGESDLALGNVVGSNIFNSLLVLPASALITPVGIPAGGVIDLLISCLLAAALIPLFLLGKARLSRFTGIILLLGYASYAAIRISQG